MKMHLRNHLNAFDFCIKNYSSKLILAISSPFTVTTNVACWAFSFSLFNRSIDGAKGWISPSNLIAENHRIDRALRAAYAVHFQYARCSLLGQNNNYSPAIGKGSAQSSI